MTKIEDDSYLKRTRATWISGKTGINFAKAHAIVQNIATASTADEKKISKAIYEDRFSSLYKKIHMK
jgi:hypothetical protein